MVDSQRIVRVKTRTKILFFEEILINNLPKLSKERTAVFLSGPEAKLKEPTQSQEQAIVR